MSERGELPQVEERCGTCRYAHPLDEYDPKSSLQCRRYPPVLAKVILPDTEASRVDERFWPLLEDSDWCGEWRAKEKPVGIGWPDFSSWQDQLSNRLINAMTASGLTSWAKLIASNPLDWDGIGPTSLKELLHRMTDAGVPLPREWNKYIPRRLVEMVSIYGAKWVSRTS